MKNLKIMIIFILIIIAILAITLIMLIPKLKEQVEEKENLNYGDILDIQKEDTEKSYIIISNCIEKYLNYNISKSNNLSFILEGKDNFEEFEENYYLKLTSVYKIERINDTTYFTECLLNNEKLYFVTNVDYINNTFNIRKIKSSEFKDAENNIVDSKYKKSIKIEKNNENIINDKKLSNEIKISNYYETYKKVAINKPEVAFEILDKEYKSKKFNNNMNTYKEYIENNKERIYNSYIIEVNAENKEEYIQYDIKDNYNNYYTIKEYMYADFSIILDNYTIQTEEQKEEYLKLNKEDKIKYNIKEVFDKIDNKDYKSVYSLLDNTFKNNNFPSHEKFEEYAKENFFDSNVLGNITIQEQGKNYIVTVPYKESTSSAAEKRKKTFIIRLLEGTDFTMSFEI